MQKSTEGLKPKEVIEIILKRRWFIIIPLCLSAIVGIYVLFLLPKIYYAQTTILIQPPKVPGDYVKPILSTDINTRIYTIQRQIRSNAHLEKLINEFNLYSGPEYKGMYLEAKIYDLRENIVVEVSKAEQRGQANSFVIGFYGKDPEKVMKITNALASYFIDENIRLKENESLGTSAFVDSEREAMGIKLEKIDEKVRRFKAMHLGELPEELDSNLRILDRLHQRLSDANNRLYLLESGRAGEETLEKMKENLANLRAKYTDQHPDVVQLTKKINELEMLNKKETEKTAEKKLLTDETGLDALRIWHQKKREKEIEDLEKEIASLKSKIISYQNRVENTPKVQQELSILVRDYKNIEKAYNSLMNRKLDADIALSLERKEKGEQFVVLDPASLPITPITSKGKKLFFMVIASGLCLGGGFIFLLEYFNTSFTSPQDIESYLGIPVFATIPKIHQPKDKLMHRLNNVFSLFSIIVSSILLAVFALLSFYGINNTMQLINRYINI